MNDTIYVSSRRSQLALFQTNYVINLLKEKYPHYTYKIGLADTIGDDILDCHLAELGLSADSGLFTKSLEVDLLKGKSHIAVHSLKDMPTCIPNGLKLGAICKREDPSDAVIIHPRHRKNGIRTLKDLPKDSIIGTSSLRREALVNKLYPHLQIKTIRGNIQTRLSKLDDKDEYDALIVAAVGFRRGGLADRIDQILDPVEFGYGVGQGSIAVECREDDTKIIEMLQSIEHEESFQCCMAERSLLHYIEGGCQICMGVHTKLENDIIYLSATILSRDGKESYTENIQGNRFNAISLGEELGKKFLKIKTITNLIGSNVTKRPLTYGNIESPGLSNDLHVK